jgi:tetraprenyl-beta-curcumene synthase
VATATYSGFDQTTLFTRSALRYWLAIFPQVCRDLRKWRRRAQEIPDPGLRSAALESLIVKRGDLEGAVAFAVCAPRPLRRRLVRGLAAWEIAFDYLDTVSEHPNPDPVANGRTLNRALITALTPGARHSDYYALHMRDGDDGYLVALIDACRAAITSLPSYMRVIEPIRRALSRIVVYQSLNHGDASGSHAAFADWAAAQVNPGANLEWWEMAAAAGSQLTILALAAAAADPRLTNQRAMAIERAYFPWVGALSTLLDSLIDQPRDKAEGQPNLVDCYDSPQQAADRLGEIASEAVRCVCVLPDADHHSLMLGAMAAFFHSQARSPDARIVTRAVLEAMGRAGSPALLVFKLRYGLALPGKRPGTAETAVHHC